MDAADQAYRDVFTAVPGIFMAKIDCDERENPKRRTQEMRRLRGENYLVNSANVANNC